MATQPDIPVPTNDARVGTYGLGCAGSADAGGMRLEFARGGRAVADPAGRSEAQVHFRALGGLKAKQVRIARTTTGFGATSGDAVKYSATLDSAGTVESLALSDANLTGDKAFPAPAGKEGNTLTLRLACDQAEACNAPNAGVNVANVRMLVSDTTRPTGGVGRNSPVGTNLDDLNMRLTVTARDEGVGLDRTELWVNGERIATADFGPCADLTPSTPQIDLPLTANACPSAGTATLVANTKDMPNGLYRRTVAVYDAAGNVANLVDNEVFEVFHPEPPISTRTLSIGSGGIAIPEPGPSGPNAGPNSDGGVAGAGAAACRSPRLSISLASKPLRTGKRIAVLQFGKKYTFTGRLTCVVNGKRKAAPKRTSVQVLNKIGKKTYKKKPVKVLAKGRLKFKLKYPVGGRTLIFRYSNADGTRSQVSIKIKTERKKKAAKRR